MSSGMIIDQCACLGKALKTPLLDSSILLKKRIDKITAKQEAEVTGYKFANLGLCT